MHARLPTQWLIRSADLVSPKRSPAVRLKSWRTCVDRFAVKLLAPARRLVALPTSITTHSVISADRSIARFTSIGKGAIGILLAAAVALSGCSDSASTSDASFIPEPRAEGPAKPGDSPVPPGPPATAEELAKLPTVDAGSRQVTDTNVLLTLDGDSIARGERPTPEAVLWWQIDGPAVQIADPSILQSAIVVPDLTAPALLTFRLAVWDEQGRANADTTTVLVQPQPVFARVVGAVVSEDNEWAVFTIRLSDPASEPLALAYRTLEGSAREFIDFVPQAGVVEFATGESEAEVAVNLLDDTETEGFKNFSLEITTALNESGVFNSGVMLIVNGDEPTLTQTLTFGEQGTVVLRVGETRTLTPDTSAAPGSGVLRWVSSDPAVALVDGNTGEVTGITPGGATVTVYKAADTDYLGAMASFEVEVIPAALLPQQLLFEREGDQSLFLDQRLTNAALVQVGGSGDLTYVAADPSVASVDQSGTVTPLAPGSTVISAIKAGDARYAEARISYNLQVAQRPLLLTAQPATLPLQAGDVAYVAITEYLSAQVPRYPNGAPQDSSYFESFEVTSSDPNVVSVEPTLVPDPEGAAAMALALLTANNPGSAIITVTKAASDGYSTATVTIAVEVDAAAVPLLSQRIVLDLDGAMMLRVDENRWVPVADPGPGSSALCYVSSDPSVVVVTEAGEMTGLEAGEATISVTKAADPVYAATATSFEVVVGRLPLPLDFEATCLEVEVGERGRNPLACDTKRIDSSELVFTSSDPAVATVDAEGNFEALAPGTTTITAFRPADGRYSATRAQYELTVSAPPTATDVSVTY